jgi:D-beta-D-heptose 7-phosphate kinase/D-beta-D-heptose 1-phosphate adenosyltransferase
LVCGDVILDRYLFGTTSRISPEAPVPVVHVGSSEERPGGAGNVAVNIASLGVAVDLIGMTGDDPAGAALQALLQARAVQCHLLQAAGFATITKVRVISQHQQLIRIDYEEPPASGASRQLLRLFSKRVGGSDIVVLSDYAKGTLDEVQELIAAARRQGKLVLIDPKGDDFSRYRGAAVLTPNQKEFEAVAGRCRDAAALAQRAEKLRADLDLEALLITRGEHGMTLVRRDAEPAHMPAQAREVFDVTGAGDTVVGVLAAALASGHDLLHAAHFANVAAGLVVARLGTASVSADELNRALQAQVQHESAILTEAQLLEVVASARRRGETIVMTNGCFDILHAGHVEYLRKAAQLGDVLIVAVNDDDSVRRLKGDGRPVNRLEDRLAVLCALECVDWVVDFKEDTPERLICAVQPDVLVKGGDYRPVDVAGAECVLRNGGRVEIIPLIKGRSSTRVIDALRQRIERAT